MFTGFLCKVLANRAFFDIPQLFEMTKS